MKTLKKIIKSAKKSLKILGAGAALGAALFMSGNAKAEEPIYKPLRGVCYGPFRESQSPLLGIYPSEAEIREDIGIIKNTAAKLRTYGTENILYNIPRYCKDAGVYCYPGAWIDNTEWDDQQVSNLISIATGFIEFKEGDSDPIRGLIVGNEFLYRHPDSKAKLTNYLHQVKLATGKQVTAAEQWHIWRDNPDLADEVDYLMIHVHPYWEDQPIESAANFVLEKYNFIKNNYAGGKPVIIGETGWPTAGAIIGAAVPSKANQKKFLEDFVQLAEENNVDYFFFSAFDELWKTNTEGEVGAHWGALDKDRALKFGLKDIIREYTRITDFNGNSLTVKTYEDDSYSIESCTNLLEQNWQTATNFSGSSNTNVTQAPLPSQGGTKCFYRAALF